MTVSLFIGALGLFLLGMWLMTEGLKLAGGQALKHLLGSWTSSRLRGLSAGILVTALVQSSSAVTVAALGFVNARLMAFDRSVWVIFGSNVGTTLTAWIVTLFGLKLDIDSVTYPLIGVGAFLQVFARAGRGKALGMALAGFGILFLGIEGLQSSFAGLANKAVYIDLLAESSYKLPLSLLLGLLLTVLTQSSSAAIALVLTALASGVLSLELAGAAVIGANVGTTSTAVIASLGATANAKRLAVAHVLFNLLTGAVAFLLLPAFLGVVLWFGQLTGQSGDPPVLLALFHTLFNVLGVVIMWPLTGYLVGFLLNRFQGTDLRKRAPFLDNNVASIPDLALQALASQLHQTMADIATRRLEKDVRTQVSGQWLEGQLATIQAAGDYIETVSRGALSEKLSERLTAGLAIKHYLHNACQAAETLGTLYREELGEDRWVTGELSRWLSAVSDFNASLASGQAVDADSRWSIELESYRVLKNALLRAVPGNRATVEEIDAALQVASLSKRLTEQLQHTLNHFAVLDETDRPLGLSQPSENQSQEGETNPIA